MLTSLLERRSACLAIVSKAFITRLIAGCARFFTLIQCFDRLGGLTNQTASGCIFQDRTSVDEKKPGS
jgi:hypothetical protein